jgi:hypothetical protein
MISSLRYLWQIFMYWPIYLWAIYRFSGYKPQPLKMHIINKWLGQFKEKDKFSILRLLWKIKYVTEKETENLILSKNTYLLERLSKSKITLKNIIYVQLHDPGSSSPVILNMLRDRGRLERKGCRFVDSKDVLELNKLTSKLGSGAIIYVDDFSGSGHQFCTVRDFISDHIIGNFSEFFLLACICEEANYELNLRRVETVAGFVHKKVARPLHPDSSIFNKATKDRLIEICNKIDPNGALGYKKLATMVVFYRNAPTSLPVILRGRVNQKGWIGILPRTTDLP